MYKATDINTGQTLSGLSEKRVAAFLVDMTGGGYTSSQVQEAMRLQEELRVEGKVQVLNILLERDDDVLPVGTKVRSYDFPHTDDYYVEGVIVEGGAPDHLDGPRYKVAVHQWIVDGRPAANFTDFVYPVISDRVVEVE